MKPGYIYVLVHPSDPDLYKIGITTRHPEQRLAEHNTNLTRPAGLIVKETGQKWALKEYHEVPDPYYAESVFWGNTVFADIPFRRGVEVEKMSSQEVDIALRAAISAGIRPPAPMQPDHVYAYTAEIRKRLEGRGIALVGHVRSIVSGKSDFRCINGHRWRTNPRLVGEGQGCPECGAGECHPDEIMHRIKAGAICLLTHPGKPGYVTIGVAIGTLDDIYDEWPWGEWEMHRYRNVYDTVLAEEITWDLLGKPLPHERQPIEKQLDIAEGEFRDLIYVMRERIADRERKRELFEDLPKLD